MCSVQDLLIETTKEGGIVGGPILHQSDQGKDPPFAAATRRSLYNGDTDESCTLEPETQEDTTTSRQYHCYPSPASDNFLDDGQTVPSKKDDVTLSIVHYRPDGIPNGKFRGQSASSIRKSRKPRTPKVNSSPGGLEIRMVKWDRITDKGTAPLNVEPRQTVPRACTLCSLSKRKVCWAKNDADISAVEQMVNVLIKRILALPAKNTISSVSLFLRRNFVTGPHKPRPWRV